MFNVMSNSADQAHLGYNHILTDFIVDLCKPYFSIFGG